jgi:hypothetical protein
VEKALPPPPPVMRLPMPLNVGSSSSNICFNCGRTIHFARDCTTLTKKNTLGW